METDGTLPTGQPLREAIESVDDATEAAAAYFVVNCAHPDHFFHVLDSNGWTRRIRGIRCNASRLSHAELDACASHYVELRERMPWINILGGCCGTDLRHIAAIAKTLSV